MKNYLKINGQKIELTEEQVERIKDSFGLAAVRLSEIPVGDTVKIGGHEMIVLDQNGCSTSLIRKNILSKKMAFGSGNNYSGSDVEKVCNAFGEEIVAVVGADNVIPHDVDLASDDGLDDYGKVTNRRASLITTDMYRRYVRTLDKHKPEAWWWLATPLSTATHNSESYVKCVSPAGFLDYYYYYFGVGGVRPFLILNSNIFVSK